MKTEDWYKKYVADSTYQRTVGTAMVPEAVRETVEHYRELARSHAHERIIEEGGSVAENAPESAYVMAFVSYALSALGRHAEALGPTMRGIRTAVKQGLDRKDPALLAKLMNMYACRLLQTRPENPWKAVCYALAGWNVGVWDNKAQDAWNCLATASEARLSAAEQEAGEPEAMRLAISDINRWMKELAMAAGERLSYKEYPEMIGFLHRNLGIEKWRTHSESAFRALFGNAKPD